MSIIYFVFILFVSPYIGVYENLDLRIRNIVQYEALDERPFSPNDQILFDTRDLSSDAPNFERQVLQFLAILGLMSPILFLILKKSQEIIGRKPIDPPTKK